MIAIARFFAFVREIEFGQKRTERLVSCFPVPCLAHFVAVVWDLAYLTLRHSRLKAPTALACMSQFTSEVGFEPAGRCLCPVGSFAIQGRHSSVQYVQGVTGEVGLGGDAFV